MNKKTEIKSGNFDSDRSSQNYKSIKSILPGSNSIEPQVTPSLNLNRAQLMLNNHENCFHIFNRYFVTDYDRLNPITKTQAIENYNFQVNQFAKKSKIVNFTKQIMDGMLSTIRPKNLTRTNKKKLNINKKSDNKQ